MTGCGCCRNTVWIVNATLEKACHSDCHPDLSWKRQGFKLLEDFANSGSTTSVDSRHTGLPTRDYDCDIHLWYSL